MARNWAIAIGINQYYNLKPLKYAKRDAESVQDFFVNEAGFEQVYYFSDDSPSLPSDRGPMRSLPTFANLKRFLRERFKEPFLTTGDNFWFFFAGHGEVHEGHDYLMPLDVDPGNVEETALRLGDITASLRNCGADNVVMLIDACRSQGQRTGSGIGNEAQQGVVIVYSCSPRESSYEVEDLQHGAFTYALLEGFRLQGANSCATVERLDQYLRYQVPMLNQCHSKPLQTPYTAVEPLSKNCLILLPQRATLQDVQALKNAAYKAELDGNLTFARQLWVRCLAASSADQDAIDAIGRIAIKQARQPSGPSSPSPSTFEFEVVTVSGQGKITERQTRQAEYVQEDLGNGVSLDLVKIPGGTFQMGAPDNESGRSRDEGPQHAVTISGFWMGKFQVTQAQWKAVASFPKVKEDLDPDPSQLKGNNRPVECISWHSAVEFCVRLSKKTRRKYRLPSEAEWEYACRAGTTTPFHFGPTITTDWANYCGASAYGEGPKGIYRKETTEVGSFKVANAFGLYDMHGNVWEWCLDHWHDSYGGLFKNAPINGSAWTTGGDGSLRVLRGGLWNNSPEDCRAANRSRDGPDGRYNVFGPAGCVRFGEGSSLILCSWPLSPLPLTLFSFGAKRDQNISG
ncbi:MAG: SUMF1/EgtB/PvdO family nonheme iron enzyme [Cyanothece sp. SIO1E1]|nr:SUMF1/EgtB/PvdO family nonheme iron enzyme [Cyanothece sp. SIO1E1]